MKVTSDVNILVSSMIAPFGTPRSIITAWREGSLELVISNGIINEVAEKLKLPRIKKKYKLTDKQIKSAITTLKYNAQLSEPQEIQSVTGDPEDDYVLATALQGGAEYLITGDIPLQNLKVYRSVKILSPKEFIKVFKKD